MTFVNSLKNWFFTNNSAAATSTARIPLLDASGNAIGSDTLSNLLKKQPLFTCNVGVATLENDGVIRFRRIDNASDYISYAVGAWVQEGGHLIIVAKDHQNATKWSASNVSGGTAIVGKEASISDFDGRTKTATIISTLGDNATAAKYCSEYYPSNVASNNGLLGAGRWWLPSGGQMWMIWSHLLEINRVMNFIGGTPLATGYCWSCSESSSDSAWCMNLSSGWWARNTKSGADVVRPVSSFY